MTSTKDTASRTTATANPPARPSLSRPHAHSISAGSLHPQHRVNRRKSSSAAGVNVAALAAAAAKDGTPLSLTPKHDSDAGGFSSRALADSGALGQPQLYGSSPKAGRGLDIHDSGNHDKVRARRASEGSALSKSMDRASTTGKGSHANDLRCETCGKGYKHGSCLTKHLWEHTPQWEVTSKLFISKHQQVQLLEAASVLVAMNQDGTPLDPSAPQDPSSSLIRDSELAAATSDSPTASGSSDPVGDDEDGNGNESSRTSTPSQAESTTATSKPTSVARPRRQDSYSSVFSRSYQSTSATSFGASSAPNDTANGLSYFRQHFTSQPGRPTTSGSSRPGTALSSTTDEHADLAAAAESLLTCSLGTPSSGPTRIPGDDVPPVPPLPAKFSSVTSPFLYGKHGRAISGSHFSQHRAAYGSNSIKVPDADHDIDMDDVSEQPRAYLYEAPLSSSRDFRGSNSRVEDDEGVFGRMDH